MKRLLPKATTTVLLMLCLMYFITYVDRVNISTAAGQFKSELGLSNTQLGFIFSAFTYPYVVFQFVGGCVRARRQTLRAFAEGRHASHDFLEASYKSFARAVIS